MSGGGPTDGGHLWLGGVGVVKRLPFSFYEHQFTRANSKLSRISRGTLKLYMEGIQGSVEARIEHELPNAFGLVLYVCSGGGRHYIAIFTVYNETTGTSGDNHDDLDVQASALRFLPSHRLMTRTT